MLKYQRDDGAGEDCGDDDLRPYAVDTPFLEDVGFHVAEECGEGEADFGGLQGEPEAIGEREDSYQGVADDAEDCDGDMDFMRGRIFVEAAGRERGEAGVVDGTTVPFFGDGAGWGCAGVLIVDAEGKGGVENTGDGEQSDEETHCFYFSWAGLD